MSRRAYTTEAAEVDAHVIDLIEARARYARTLAQREAMDGNAHWRKMLDAAGLTLRDAVHACRGCAARLVEIDGQTAAAEEALR